MCDHLIESADAGSGVEAVLQAEEDICREQEAEQDAYDGTALFTEPAEEAAQGRTDHIDGQGAADSEHQQACQADPSVEVGKHAVIIPVVGIFKEVQRPAGKIFQNTGKHHDQYEGRGAVLFEPGKEQNAQYAAAP